MVISTPTASGKTLVYNAPIVPPPCSKIRTLRALYIFPLKALVQDQFDELKSLLRRLDSKLRVDIFDGDTPAHARRKIKSDPPHLLITTPDMLHAGMLAFHEQWADFFKALRFVVIDELHTYSGIFGSHILHLFRRFNRVCSSYGSRPRVITSSATIGNPTELASSLFNRRFHAVVENGAPSAAPAFPFPQPHPKRKHPRRQPVAIERHPRPANHRVHPRSGRHRAHLPLGHSVP